MFEDDFSSYGVGLGFTRATVLNRQHHILGISVIFSNPHSCDDPVMLCLPLVMFSFKFVFEAVVYDLL